jgi:hypothetical protein
LDVTKVSNEYRNLVLGLSEDERESLHAFTEYVLNHMQPWFPRIFSFKNNPIAAAVKLASMLQMLERQLR